MGRIRLLLADRSDDFRDGIVAWLRDEPRVELVATVRTGPEAVEAAHRLRPDLVLMDVRLPRVNGVEATRRIKRRAGAPAVALMTFHYSEAVRREALAAGVDHVIPKSEVTGRLLTIVRDMLVGGSRRDSTPRTETPQPGRRGPSKDVSR